MTSNKIVRRHMTSYMNIASYLIRYQFYQKMFRVKIFQYEIGELSTIILKICKKCHFHGKHKIKIVLAPIKKSTSLKFFFHRTSFNWSDRRFLPNLGCISFIFTVLFNKNLSKLVKNFKKPYKRRLRFFLHG